MDQELKTKIAALAEDRATKEIRFKQLAMQNTAQDPDKRKAQAVEFELARAEYHEAKRKLYDLQRSLGGDPMPANAVRNYAHLCPGFTGYTGQQGDPLNVFGIPDAKGRIASDGMASEPPDSTPAPNNCVHVSFVNGSRVVGIRCTDEKLLPSLQDEARRILRG
jgi:hypothetical protein